MRVKRTYWVLSVTKFHRHKLTAVGFCYEHQHKALSDFKVQPTSVVEKDAKNHCSPLVGRFFIRDTHRETMFFKKTVCGYLIYQYCLSRGCSLCSVYSVCGRVTFALTILSRFCSYEKPARLSRFCSYYKLDYYKLQNIILCQLETN
jgi:hypothetical protein